MGLSSKDIRIFYNSRTRDWIIANDNKYRKLIDRGYSKKRAEKESHGHLNSEDDCIAVKENILSNKRIKSRDIWKLGCYVRVCDKTYRHYKWVCGLYNTKINKNKSYFYNVGGGKGARL